MRGNILIVDDEPNILATLKFVLEGEGYRVKCASGGREAVRMFGAETFDLVITDIRMPEMDGIEVLKQVKQMDSAVEVIILTGFATIENAVETLRNGLAFDYLSKPLENIETLTVSVRRALEKRKLRQENQALLEELFRVKRLKSLGILAGGIAHDFNNLLSVIMGCLSLATDELQREAKTFSLLQEAQKAALRAGELTQQLIFFSKGGAPVKKPGSFAKFIDDTTTAFTSESPVACNFSVPPDLWPVDFDPSQMKHVVKTLIDNAVESMTDNRSIDVKAENVEIDEKDTKHKRLMHKGKYVKISIKDHGAGISEDHLPFVFDPYFSTKDMGTQKGLGLGLATAYSIVKRHDGHITVESEVGVGTTFTIFLPAAVSDIPAVRPEAVPPVDKPPVTTKKILVMDDEEMIRHLAELLLERLGYTSAVASDGGEAIELYQSALNSGKPYDAVILDLTVKKGMGGKDAVKKLLEINPHVKAIVSSGYSSDPVITDYAKYGFSQALSKPYTIKELDDVLNQIAQ